MGQMGGRTANICPPHSLAHLLTRCKDVIPPVRLADVGLEVVRRPGHDDLRWAHDGPDGEEHGEDGHDDPEPLDEIQVRDLDGLGGSHPENH